MKKTTKFIAVIALITLMFTGCSEVKDSIDSIKCLDELLKYYDYEGDLTCSEQISELQSLRNACPDTDEDGSIQELIDLTLAYCED
ncbi:hypothetical protein Q4Q35_05240 [Flavivirga aquimarina]|uniref:Lipoprotein n=1 Tax=Flavivirga aquimarina TaxID=2027862 RepID=A0ABT8W7Z1_9FLAO|nr:hypothetical protein [Flavivirga aquimarina]MDO5969206.1 hypothetical protein [Flavivirga aquimarina]